MSNEQDAFANNDVDFDKVQRRRQQYLARKAAERGEPLLSGMDADGKDDDKPQQQQQGRFAGIGLGFLTNALGGDNQSTGTGAAGFNNSSNNNNNNNASDSSNLNNSSSNTNNNAYDATNNASGGSLDAAAVAQANAAAIAAANAKRKEKEEQEEGYVGIFGGKKVIRWPYDDYHEVQKKYYTKLEELEEAENKSDDDGGTEDANASAAASSNNKGGGRGFFGFGRGDAIESTVSQTKQNQPSTLQRPDDPPDVPTAVQGLQLSEFERKAEERAIQIVSTWLFDCGLIDELLVHGGMGKSTMRMASKHYGGTNNNGVGGKNNNADDSTTVSSAKTSTAEGIEIGAFGHIIEGPSKMDKEIGKLRGGTARQLTMVNSRLNDGVAASGGEVQELVNAVNSTKDDLGRLRELSTYIGGVGSGNSLPNDGNTVGGEEISLTSSKSSGVKNNMMARSQTFMLTKYPKLKKAINARRNLARCFRELDFYSQIPLTCDRLREDLHQAEWTDVEWSSLRDVSREHVELEVFLVEAEAGMKKRIEEEILESHGGGNNNDGDGGDFDNSRRSHLRQGKNGGRSGSSRFGGSRSHMISSSALGRLQNYEEVDNFLHEHVKNVWELGDEIRMRIMSGIGGAFDLATNNPAGLVALVEAVEVYESANEEYKSVHGEETGGSGSNDGNDDDDNEEKSDPHPNPTKDASGSDSNLRFTDMRASALKQLYQDFELRGMEVFREVHEEVSCMCCVAAVVCVRCCVFVFVFVL